MNNLKTAHKKAKNKKDYKLPTAEVTNVELEGLIAASQILVEPDKDNFNRYNWDEQEDKESQDIELLF